MCRSEASLCTAITTPLIKATQPFERLSIDFKGPLPSINQNKYLLVICDKFSRFPFAFVCKDVSSRTVINHLRSLFSVFGMLSCIHSDRGASFMSNELKSFLHSKGIATSRTTPYNLRGNSQVERLNGTLWKTITLALKSNNLPTTSWQFVLDDALHSMRSLLCTATNCTSHERLFNFTRRSTNGTAVSFWLLTPGPVLLKRHTRASKYDPFFDEVYLIEANPLYAHVRFQSGREDTVAIKHLAPSRHLTPTVQNSSENVNECCSLPTVNDVEQTSGNAAEKDDDCTDNITSSNTDIGSTEITCDAPSSAPLRRNQRNRRSPDRLTYF